MKKEELIHYIENFKNKKILVLGDAILDIYVEGTPEKICREAPVMVYNTGRTQTSCGGAANTAINIATLGAECYFMTVVGRDENARQLQAILKKEKVNTEYIFKDKNRTTVAKKRIVSGSNILMRLDEGSKSEISTSCQNAMEEALDTLFSQIHAIILSDYSFGLFPERIIKKLMQLSKKRSVPLIIDSRDLKKFAGLRPDAVKPNYEETIQLLNLSPLAEKRTEQILAVEKDLFEITGAQKVVVTLDKDGVLLFEKGKPAFNLSCVRKENKNAIGAGDTFVSALALSLSAGLDGKAAVTLASGAAAMVVQQQGTSSCSNQELKNYFNTVPKHIGDHGDLVRLVRDIKKSGKKIVFSNGIFDIIHKGHIALLNAAKELGDILIIGINTDESVKKIKGPERPIFCLDDRIAVSAELESVDHIISFAEDSPEELLRIIHPQVFVKGGTYTVNSIPEAPLLKKLNCAVKIIHYPEEHYTTKIINRIRDLKRAGTAINEVKREEELQH